MNELLTTLAILAAMAGVVAAFRLLVRRPRGVSSEDPPGVRSVAVFFGSSVSLFCDDPPDGLLVGVAFFRELCDALAASGIEIVQRGTLQNAQHAVCEIGGERLALVLERIEDRWVLSVEWTPRRAAERRHVALTHEAFAPKDGPGLRRLLAAVDAALRADARLSGLRWHRKQDWMAEDASQPSDSPL